MTRYDIAFLTIRGFAIYAWFQALEYFAGGTLSFLLNNMLQYSLVQRLSIFPPCVIFLAAGIFLFAFTRPLASRLSAGGTATETFPPHPLATDMAPHVNPLAEEPDILEIAQLYPLDISTIGRAGFRRWHEVQNRVSSCP